MNASKSQTTGADAARILIVDDNPGIHRDFELVLCESNAATELDLEEQRLYGKDAPLPVPGPQYVLEHAHSGAEGLEHVKHSLSAGTPFQLAFVDIRMPGMDGVETIVKIWQLDSRIQIVICTAYADYSWEELVRRLGQTDQLLVLKKPFDNLEVTLLASTLTEKWFLARQAALKLEEMERLVAQRTQKLLELEPAQRKPAMEDTAAGATAEAGAAGRELPLVLLVALEPQVRLAVNRDLAASYRLSEASDTETGMNQAQEMIPDLVLVALPDQPGLEFCRRLKQSELGSHIPVVLLASSSVADPGLQTAEAGADDCLCSPFSAAALRECVEQVLARHRSSPPKLNPESTISLRDLAQSRLDAQFLRRLVDTVERHLADYEFDVDALAQKLALSRRQLFRKLKAVAGATPNLFIRNLRLKRAAQLLRDSHLTVTEITYAVGFADLKHFRTVFREQFGVLPTEYASRARSHPAAETEPPSATLS